MDTFNRDIVTQTVGVSIRTGPFATIHQKYPGFNQTLWNQPPHVDQCYADFTEAAIQCKPNSYLFRDYSVILYLNEIENGGGDFVFLDFPGKPIGESILLSKNDQKLRRSLQANTTRSTSYVDFEQIGIFKQKGEYTVIPPRPGRLLAFDSGLSNIHAVTEIFDPTVKRYTFAMWFLGAEKATHIQPPEPTVQPEMG